MSNLVACQPGWVAVFELTDGDGFSTEPVACWLQTDDDDVTVRPICALGADVVDATTALNYIGVAAPGRSPEALLMSVIAARNAAAGARGRGA